MKQRLGKTKKDKRTGAWGHRFINRKLRDEWRQKCLDKGHAIYITFPICRQY